MKRINFLGAPMDSASMDESLSYIDDNMAKGQLIQHVVVNVAKLVNMQKDKALADSVRACDIINIDGMGVVWGARLCGHQVSERVAGIDLFQALLALAEEKSYSVYFLGATENTVAQLVTDMSQRFPQLKIAGAHHGYFWDDEQAIVEQIKNSQAQMLFVAISSPKKEIFINRWKGSLGINFVMGVGGSFDVLTGKVKRAPLWMQRTGLEWFYRIIQEPRRMWKRYLVTNCLFLGMLLKEKFYRKY